MFTLFIGSNSFYQVNSVIPARSSADLDPLVDLNVDISIERVRKLLIEEEPSFSIKITVEEQVWESEIFNGYDVIGLDTAYFNIPDETEEVLISIEVQERERKGDISSEREELVILYNVLTGSWKGDDFLKDKSGYGHSSGHEDGTTNDSDYEIWFEVGFNDYDKDCLTYWEEVNIYGTDPEESDLEKDYDDDGIPIEWEDHWGYDPFMGDNHARLDPDKDGIQNIEEYEMKDWFADPFRQDIFIENDYMAPGGNTQHIMPEKSNQMQYSAFTKHNIMLLIDDGIMGGSDEIPYDKSLDWNEMNDIYDTYFLHNNQNNPRKGIFHYAIICHEIARWNLLQVGGMNFRRDAFIVASAYIQKWRPWEEGTVIAHGSIYMHELGHSLGLDHLRKFPWQLEYWLSTNFKSCMNYRYTFKLINYSDGTHGFMDYDEWNSLNLQKFERE